MRHLVPPACLCYLLDERDWKGSKAACEAAIQLGCRGTTDSSSIHFVLGISLESLGDFDRAEDEFRRAIADDYFNCPLPYTYLAVLLARRRENYADAQEYLNAAIRVDSTCALPWFELGALLEEKFDDITGAKAAFRAAADCGAWRGRLSPSVGRAKERLDALLQAQGGTSS